MEKIELGTPDGIAGNIERLAELFPQVVTEVENADGELECAVDFDTLRDLLGDVVEGQRERYQFTWPGKREAKADLQDHDSRAGEVEGLGYHREPLYRGR